MKGTVNVGTHGSKTGGDIGFPGCGTQNTPRNIRRLLKKYPNDLKVQSLLNSELEKFTYKSKTQGE